QTNSHRIPSSPTDSKRACATSLLPIATCCLLCGVTPRLGRFSTWTARSILGPDVGRNAAGQLKHLNHRATGKHLHDGAGCRLDLRRCLAHFNAGDPFDLPAENVGGVGEQLAVKLLYLVGAGGTPG